MSTPEPQRPTTATSGGQEAPKPLTVALAGFPSNRGDFGCGDLGQRGARLLVPAAGGAGWACPLYLPPGAARACADRMRLSAPAFVQQLSALGKITP